MLLTVIRLNFIQIEIIQFLYSETIKSFKLTFQEIVLKSYFYIIFHQNIDTLSVRIYFSVC